jgi:hypothetical protein
MKIEMLYSLLAFATVLAPMAQGQSTPPQPKIRYKRVVLCSDGSHELPVFRTAEPEIIDMIKSFTVTPRERGHAGLHESVFVLPKGEKPDGRGAGRLGRKAERARPSPDPELGSLRESPLISLPRQRRKANLGGVVINRSDFLAFHGREPSHAINGG